MKWSEFFTSSIGKKLADGFNRHLSHSFFSCACWYQCLHLCRCFDPTDNGEIFNRAAHFMAVTHCYPYCGSWSLCRHYPPHCAGLYAVLPRTRAAVVQGYAVPMGNKGSKWYSRSMGLLGTLLLLFLVLHVSQFWWDSRMLP